jgi:hypothetical protein
MATLAESNSNLATVVVPCPGNPAAAGICQPPNPRLSAERQGQLRRLAAMLGESVRGLAEAFGIGRATAYRYLKS